MEVAALLLVLSSGMMHAIWNLFTKKSANKIVFLWLIHILATILLFPYFVYELLQIKVTSHLLLMLTSSIAFQGGYFIFLAKAYSYGDLSQVYPTMRGAGALLVPVLSVMFFGESLSLGGWVGLFCIVGGLFAISGIYSKKETRQSSKPIALVYAFIVGVFITGYTLLDRQIVQQFSPVALIEISNITYVAFSTRMALKSKQVKHELKANWKMILIGMIFAPGSYLLFLFAMQLAPLAVIAPIREIGTVFGTLLGVLLLKEQQGLKRIVMSCIIMFGIMTIAMSG